MRIIETKKTLLTIVIENQKGITDHKIKNIAISEIK